MSFWVVPRSCSEATPMLPGVGHVQGEQPRRRGVDRHRRVHLAHGDAVEQLAHVPQVGHRDADLARPPPAPGGRRGRSRSGSAGRRRSTARSGPWPGSCGTARWTPGRSSGPSRSASSRAGPWAGGSRPWGHRLPGRRATATVGGGAGRDQAKGSVRHREGIVQQLEVAGTGHLDGAEGGQVRTSATARRAAPRRWPAAARPAPPAPPSTRRSPGGTSTPRRTGRRRGPRRALPRACWSPGPRHSTEWAQPSWWSRP